MSTTLTEVFTSIANAIRSKTGTTGAIAVNDMATRIAGISSDTVTTDMQAIIDDINTLIGV